MSSDNTGENFHKTLLPLYILAGCFSLAFSGIYILVVPLSSLFWPNEPFHALEMGILIASMFFSIAIAGFFFGKLIDKYNRVKIFFVVAMVRGFCILMLNFTIMGEGLASWTYFYIFILIFSFFAGGNYPTIVSLSHDIVPKEKRSKFFGVYNIIRFSFQLSGFVFVGFLIQVGLWRLIFIIIGSAIIIAGIYMVLTLQEPKRGAQREELREVLKEESIQYDFQIDKEMMRETMLSKTNKIALIEGIFTSIYMGSLSILSSAR